MGVTQCMEFIQLQHKTAHVLYYAEFSYAHTLMQTVQGTQLYSSHDVWYTSIIHLPNAAAKGRDRRQGIYRNSGK